MFDKKYLGTLEDAKLLISKINEEYSLKIDFDTTIQQLEAELAKARKLKKSTKDIKAKIAAMTEEMMDDDEEQVEETPSMFSNVKINENCVPAEVATLLNKN